VLETFMESKIHHGIIVDEFGSLLGLVTMNDLLNDLVGNLSEEESISYEFVQRDDNSWLVDGMYPFIDLLKKFEIDDEPYRSAHFHTVAGFMINKLKKLPATGDIVNWKGYKMEVVDMDHRRVDKILITKAD
jgi:putative hemolysin